MKIIYPHSLCRWRDWPIRRKLLLIILAMVITSTALVMAGTFAYDAATYRDRLIQRVDEVGSFLAANSAPALAFDDQQTARDILNTMRASPEITVAALYTADGRVFASYLRADRPPITLPPKPGPEGTQFTGRHIESVRTITQKGVLLGTFYLSADMAGVYLRLRDHAKILLAVVLALVGGAVLLQILLKRLISEPLWQLSHMAVRIAGGDLEARIPENSLDEIGQLAKMLNHMSAELAHSHAELHYTIDHLEELVRDRTTELVVAKEQAEAASHAKSVFLANMSHELRTPMNAILGYAQLMQKKILSPTEKREYLNTIHRNGEHLLSLINDVLAISKIEAGQMTFDSTTFDLQALLVDLENAFASSVNRKGLFIKIIGIDDLPRYIATDENKLRQVLANILGNAIKFTEQGGITMRVAAKDKTAGAMRLAFEVQDTGIGIAEDELGKAFVYFEQMTGGRTQKDGTGLGLAISRDYVRLMGGDITVTSELGKGSTFRFEIDIKRGCEKDLAARVSRQRVLGLQPGRKVPRVLVAEDKSDSRILLVKILETAGFEVKEAVDGEEAVGIFKQWRPDFIWMDIRMPVMDGMEATRRIKRSGAGRSTIVAALTAQALEEEKEQILAAGFDDFVRKPFREQEIFEVMGKHLGLQYAYEDELVAPDAEVKTEAQVTPRQLAALPVELRRRLHDAVVELDKERILALSEQIKTIDTYLARALDDCVQKFALSSLLDLLEKFERLERGDKS